MNKLDTILEYAHDCLNVWQLHLDIANKESCDVTQKLAGHAVLHFKELIRYIHDNNSIDI